MDEGERAKLLAEYDSYSEGKRYAISRACWKTFIDFCDAIHAVVHHEFMNEVLEGKRQLNESFLDDVDREVDSILLEYLNGKQAERAQLDELRARLKSYIAQQN